MACCLLPTQGRKKGQFRKAATGIATHRCKAHSSAKQCLPAAGTSIHLCSGPFSAVVLKVSRPPCTEVIDHVDLCRCFLGFGILLKQKSVTKQTELKSKLKKGEEKEARYSDCNAFCGGDTL